MFVIEITSGKKHFCKRIFLMTEIFDGVSERNNCTTFNEKLESSAISSIGKLLVKLIEELAIKFPSNALTTNN